MLIENEDYTIYMLQYVNPMRLVETTPTNCIQTDLSKQ